MDWVSRCRFSVTAMLNPVRASPAVGRVRWIRRRAEGFAVRQPNWRHRACRFPPGRSDRRRGLLFELDGGVVEICCGPAYVADGRHRPTNTGIYPLGRSR